MNLVRAELFKLRTTSIWWIMAIILVPLYGLSVLFNWLSISAQQDVTARDAAVSLYTTGQYMGVLIVLLLSAIIVTSEFFHLTATTTFLVTPNRAAVILAKFGASVIVGVLVWIASTLLNLVFAPLVLSAQDFPAQLGDSAVWRAIALNGLAFALWSVVGVGVGVLIRSQIATTLILAIVYVVGTTAAQIIFGLLSLKVADWFDNLQVIVPTVASSLMITGEELPGHPPQWLGGLILVGYAVLTGVLGTLITKRRDIS